MGIIDKIITGKNRLKYGFSVNPNKEVIIDFYNIYCNFINFDKHKEFTRNSFEKCLDITMRSSFNQTFFVVSKPIFEVDQMIIEKYTMIYKNLVYIIVEDNFPEKTFNRERDDFVCLMLNCIKNQSFIITNDRFANYETILKNIKPFTIKTIYRGTVTETVYDENSIKEVIEKMRESKFKFKRKQFKFTKN